MITGLPVKQGAFHIPESPDDKPYLIGSRCRVCGYTTFPKKQICIKCRRDDTSEEIKLGPYATLETFTVMRVGRPDFTAPYVMGYVRMKEGVLVFTLITGCEPKDDTLHLGEEMEMVIDKIKVDEQCRDVIGWKFRPRGRAQ